MSMGMWRTSGKDFLRKWSQMVMAGHNASGPTNQGALLHIYKVPMTWFHPKGLCKAWTLLAFPKEAGEVCQVIWGRESVLNY